MKALKGGHDAPLPGSPDLPPQLADYSKPHGSNGRRAIWNRSPSVSWPDRTWNGAMQSNRHILIVSSRIENKNTLLSTLDGLPVSTFTVAKIEHAFEVLLSSPIDLVFCEEHVTDGSYRELLSAVHARDKMTPFVLILCTGKWEECLEAVRLGATEVLRCPLEPTDINLTLVRAMRDKEYADGELYVSPCPTLGTAEPAEVCEYAGGIGELRMLIRRPTP